MNSFPGIFFTVEKTHLLCLLTGNRDQITSPPAPPLLNERGTVDSIIQIVYDFFYQKIQVIYLSPPQNRHR